MFEAPHTPRAHWRQLFEQLAATAPETLRERMQWLQRQVRENGVTYNVYADPRAPTAPGNSTCCRCIIPAAEWAGIEAAVRQRATLLNRVLADVYGEQRLLQEGLLPPALVYGHAGFLRPCRGIARRPAASCCTCTPPTSRARPTGAGG